MSTYQTASENGKLKLGVKFFGLKRGLSTGNKSMFEWVIVNME